MFCYKRSNRIILLAVCVLVICLSLCSCNRVQENSAELIARYSDGAYPLKVAFINDEWAFLVDDTNEGCYGVSVAPDPTDFNYIHYIEDVTIRRLYSCGNCVVWSEISDIGLTYMYYALGMQAADYASSVDQFSEDITDSVAVDGNNIYHCYVNVDSYEVLLYETDVSSGSKRIVTKVPFIEKLPRIVFSVKNGYLCIAIDNGVAVIKLSDKSVVTSFTLQETSVIKHLVYDSELNVCSVYFSGGADNVIVLADGKSFSKTSYVFPDGTGAYEDFVDFSAGKLRWVEKTGNNYKYVEYDPLTETKTETERVFSFTYKDGELYTLRYGKGGTKTVELYKE